jgi:peptidylprolyl isomerase
MKAFYVLAAALVATAPANAQSWRPHPQRGVTEPADVIAHTSAADWQAIPDEDLLVLDLAGGRVVIQLAPEFAPVHVANIRALARGNWWANATIYRVQDNYVVQWGNNETEVPLPQGVVRAPPAEYERPLAGLRVRPLGYPDPYAAAVGHAGAWGVALDRREGVAWLPHCYGTVGVGRDLAPDTGTGGELYAVIGHAPRPLDRNIANIGRVIEGIALLSPLPRGTGNLGFYQVDHGERPIPFAHVRIAADLPAAERPHFEYLRTDTPAFGRWVLGRANRGGTFFNRPAGGVDICSALPPVRRHPS